VYFMGVDHHKQYSHMTVMDAGGQVLKADRMLNFRRDVEEFLRDLDEPLEAVIEAGRSSYGMADLLEELGVRVKMAHPSEVKAIARAKIKTDKRDSRVLADLLRAGLVPEVHKRAVETRRAQRVLRQRVFFVAMMTRVKNRIRALLAQQEEMIRKAVDGLSNLYTRKGLERLRTLELPLFDRRLLDSLLELFVRLEELIKSSDRLVDALYQQMEGARRISTVPGFGKFFSVLVATEIDDVGRFESADKLHSYAGVIPSTFSSGDRCYHGKIVKAGNRWLRWAAVEAVWPAIRADWDLRVFYEKRALRKNSNMAKVATARRLLTIIYKLLTERRDYRPYLRTNKRNYRLPSYRV